MSPLVDLLIVGAGAAGSVAAIQAARAQPGLKILLVDSRPDPGAKIRVSGGGRCNIGNVRVGVGDFHGGDRLFIAKVLKAFPPQEVLRFFHHLHLPLVEEGEGRLYPASQRAADVVDALRRGCRQASVGTRFAFQVDSLRRVDGLWRVGAGPDFLMSRRVILATGGCSLPKSGSDGRLFPVLEGLGLPLRKPFTPALAALALTDGHPLRALAGLSAEVFLKLPGCPGSWGKSLLITHFGLSGPAVLNASRHLLQAALPGGTPPLVVDWLPDLAASHLEGRLSSPMGARRMASVVGDWLPQRLARLQLDRAGLSHDLPMAQLDRLRRRRLVQLLKEDSLPVKGARSWHHAECTAGGLHLEAFLPETLEAGDFPGLHACGEMLDVDGRLGGFNFHWAWASASVAARAAAKSLSRP
jgi:predicted Rossmann fold flavoprotein